MELSLTEAQVAFRDEVVAFLSESLPEDIKETQKTGGHLSKEQTQRWHKILGDKGWSTPLWPIEHGGTGWSPVEYAIFDEECYRVGAPRVLPFSVSMLGPVLINFGNDEQRERFLPGIRSGEDWWAQGFSEPGSGSDLASLKTSAVRDGDHYIINGQKTWTTLGQHGDWIFCLVRTDADAAKPQTGISFILVDMKSPGVEVRPIITLDGSHEVNEVWFTDVKVPAENLVGQENMGWTYANSCSRTSELALQVWVNQKSNWLVSSALLQPRKRTANHLLKMRVSRPSFQKLRSNCVHWTSPTNACSWKRSVEWTRVLCLRC